MNQPDPPSATPYPPTEDDLDFLARRIGGITWSLIIICLVCLLLVDAARMPPGYWALAIGVIMLAHSLARKRVALQVSGFSLLVSALVLAAGVICLFFFPLPLLPILLILVGSKIVLRPLFERH